MGGAASSPLVSGGSYGYHVLRVQEGSPGHKAGLEAFFDFIISIGNIRLEKDDNAIKQLLHNHKNKTVRLVVYSSKAQNYREVFLTPNDTWGGQGLLGVSIRYCTFEGASENVWHILSVYPNSPASIAGLVAETDYIIGSDSDMNEFDDFLNLVESADGQSLLLYVYNSESDSCRDVRITPNSKWGGEGLLGCDIGFGYLHRIPASHFLHTETMIKTDMSLANAAVDDARHANVAKATAADVSGVPVTPSSADGAVVPQTSNVASPPMHSFSGIPPVENGAPPPVVSAVSDRLSPLPAQQAVAPSAPTSPPRNSVAAGVPNLPPPAPLPPGIFTPTFQPVPLPSHPHPPAQPPMQQTGFYQPAQFVTSAQTAPSGSFQHAPFMVPPVMPAANRSLPQSPPQAFAGQTSAPREAFSGSPGQIYPPATSATAVISLPGMPPLDVSMPPLAGRFPFMGGPMAD